MRAMVYHGNKDLRLENVPEPDPGSGQVKLRIDYCGICATDIEEYLYGPVFISGDTPNPITGKMMPVIIGHEITGTVAETGEGDGKVCCYARAASVASMTHNSDTHSPAPPKRKYSALMP